MTTLTRFHVAVYNDKDHTSYISTLVVWAVNASQAELRTESFSGRYAGRAILDATPKTIIKQ